MTCSGGIDLSSLFQGGVSVAHHISRIPLVGVGKPGSPLSVLPLTTVTHPPSSLLAQVGFRWPHS